MCGYVLVDVSLGGYNMCMHGLISEEHRELQQLHTCKKEEYEGVVLKLQSRMKRANDELEQVRDSLRTLKEANGHGWILFFFYYYFQAEILFSEL